MQIQTLEQLTGLERATIRYYEKEALITPLRLENGYRDYSKADMDTLLKIRLLRELGISLDGIRTLQNGETDLYQTLFTHLQYLRSQAAALGKVHTVCKEMLEAGECFETLDPKAYLKVLSQPSLAPAEEKPPVFHEQIRRARVHPVRRFVARQLDHFLLSVLLYSFFAVVLRVRPYMNVILPILTYGAWWLMVPLEALFLSRLGTTPGKWVMGIHLEAFQGGRFTYTQALHRAYLVLRNGMGYGVPAVSLAMMVRSYIMDCDCLELDWDYESEMTGTDWNWKRGLLFAGAVSVSVLIMVFSIYDTLLPRYRGKDITIPQFGTNFNDYSRLGAGNNMLFTTPDSSDLVFDTENGYIRKITFERQYQGATFQAKVPSNCYYAILALAGSRPGVTGWKLKELERELDKFFKGDPEVDNVLAFADLRISWHGEVENMITSEYIDYLYSEANNGKYHLFFTIEIC